MRRFKPEIKVLIFLHRSLLMGQVILIALIYFTSTRMNNTTPNQDFGKALQTVVAIATIGCVAAGFIIFKKKVTSLQQGTQSFSEKLTQYRTASIIKYALLQGPCLFSMILFFLNKNPSSLFLSLILIVLFSMQTPAAINISYDLKVSVDDLYE